MRIFSKRGIGLFFISLLSFVATPALAAAPDAAAIMDNIPFSHKWVKNSCQPDDCSLWSSYAPPKPWPGKTEAMLSLSIAARTETTPKTVKTLLKHEMQGIRASLTLADYTEDDGKKVENGIASWTKTINGKPVGFIKYRVQPAEGLPFTVLHGIVLGDEAVYYTQMISFFAGHQDEIRQDQLSLINEIAGQS